MAERGDPVYVLAEYQSSECVATLFASCCSDTRQHQWQVEYQMQVRPDYSFLILLRPKKSLVTQYLLLPSSLLRKMYEDTIEDECQSK